MQSWLSAQGNWLLLASQRKVEGQGRGKVFMPGESVNFFIKEKIDCLEVPLHHVHPIARHWPTEPYGYPHFQGDVNIVTDHLASRKMRLD